MTMNYAKSMPIDRKGNNYETVPPYPAFARNAGVPIASSVITFNDNTTVFDVTVIGGQAGNAVILGKWGSASVTASNYDWVVGSGNTRTFVIPQSVIGTTSVAGANVMNGLYPTCAVIVGNAQSASIFTAEY